MFASDRGEVGCARPLIILRGANRVTEPHVGVAAKKITPNEQRPLGDTGGQRDLCLAAPFQAEQTGCLEKAAEEMIRFQAQDFSKGLKRASRVGTVKKINPAKHKLQRFFRRKRRGQQTFLAGFLVPFQAFEAVGAFVVPQPRGNAVASFQHRESIGGFAGMK